MDVLAGLIQGSTLNTIIYNEIQVLLVTGEDRVRRFSLTIGLYIEDNL